MRPEIDRGDELRPRVREYADRHNLTMSAAWAQIVALGLDAAEDNSHDG